MATRHTLAYVEQRMKADRSGTYSLFELVKWLANCKVYTGTTWKPGHDLSQATEEIELPGALPLRGVPAMLTVPSKGWPRKHLHLVFWDGEWVRDPSPDEPDTSSLSNYEVQELAFLAYEDD